MPTAPLFINVFTIGPDSKQYWTNTLNLDRIVVSTILINSTLELVAGKFITLGVSSGTISTLTTTFINADSTITTSTMNAGNITYSTLTGIIGTTTLLTASTTNTTNIGFSTGSGLYLITNGLTVNTSIVTSTLNGINKQSHPNEGFKQPQGPLRSMGRDVPFTMGTLGAG